MRLALPPGSGLVSFFILLCQNPLFLCLLANSNLLMGYIPYQKMNQSGLFFQDERSLRANAYPSTALDQIAKWYPYFGTLFFRSLQDVTLHHPITCSAGGPTNHRRPTCEDHRIGLSLQLCSDKGPGRDLSQHASGRARWLA